MKRLIVLLITLVVLIPAYAAADEVDNAQAVGKKVALTIENVENPVQMENMLRLCQEQNITVTFLIAGKQLDQYPIEKALTQGHEISNHRTNKNYLSETSKEGVAADLADVAKVIRATTGFWPRVVSPLYNNYDQNFCLTVESLSKPMTRLQGENTGEWLADAPEAMLGLVIGSMKTGDIINVDMKTKAALVLPAVITEIKRAGYRFVTLSELLAREKPQKLAQATKQKKAIPFAVIKRISTKQPDIALTFDDSGSDRQVNEILDILHDTGTKATFFLVGEWADINPDFIRRAVQEGHEIANHSYSHPYFTRLDEDEMRDQILTTQHVLERVIGSGAVRLFRPPYGDYDATVINVLRNLGYDALVMWDVDSRDWTGLSAETLVSRVSTRVTSGSIVLFHLHGAHTAEALRELIPLLKLKGYMLTTVSTMLNESESVK